MAKLEVQLYKPVDTDAILEESSREKKKRMALIKTQVLDLLKKSIFSIPVESIVNDLFIVNHVKEDPRGEFLLEREIKNAIYQLATERLIVETGRGTKAWTIQMIF